MIELNAATLGLTPPPIAVDPRPSESPLRLLVLQNPGKMSRNSLEGIIRGAMALGIEHRVVEMAELWQRKQVDVVGLTRDMEAFLRRERIGAVVGYVLNGAFDMQCERGPDGQPRNLFGAMGIPHLMLWIDHPHWACEKVGLAPHLQSVLRSPNNHHFLKSESAALELRRFLKWSNCHALPVAEDPGLVSPAHDVVPDYDVVTIFGSPPRLEEALVPFLDHDDPNVGDIMSVVGETVRRELRALWRRDAPPPLQPALDRFGDAWSDLRQADERIAAVWHFEALSSSHQDAASWLLEHAKCYFDAVEHLWRFGAWQRTFYLRYLSRYFRTAVFGKDWSSVGLGGGEWIDHSHQAAIYARGKVAINLSQGSDEEGLALKPFQIAAAGVPMVHIDRRGLADCFHVGVEVATFGTPREAREVIGSLLSDPDRRTSMAVASRARAERDHTWANRLLRMLTHANLSPSSFQLARHTAPVVSG